jgi:hypothetical protein
LNNDTYPTERAVPTATATDRAIAGPDQPDFRGYFDEAPEQPNRRGRRHLARDMKRTDRNIFRSLVRQETEALAKSADVRTRG